MLNKYNFDEVKDYALKCKNKEKGRVHRKYYYMRYHPSMNNITIRDRYNQQSLLATINSNGTVTVNAPEESLLSFGADRITIEQLGDFYIEAIPSKQRERLIDATVQFCQGSYTDGWKKYVYVPNETIFNLYGELVQVGSYQKITVDPEWDRWFINASKKVRAKVAAIDAVADIKCHESAPYYQPPDAMAKLLKNPVKIDLDAAASIKSALCLTPRTIRKGLQKYFDEQKLLMAEDEGAIKIVVCKQELS